MPSHHLDLVVDAGADFCNKLEEISCGDKSTGFGSQLSDAAVSRLAAACPNLRKVYLTSAVQLTDWALGSLLWYCPNIHTLSITGNDKVKGKIEGICLLNLKKSKEQAQHLRKLELVDQQRLDKRVLKCVSTARKQLIISEGDTSDRWYDLGCIDTWTGGKLQLGESAVKTWFD